jgi:uncharacterized lipoprotein YddW (UPF0748 family)
MRKFLLIGICFFLLFFSPQLFFYANGQNERPKKAFKSDSSLLALAKKYVSGPIKRTHKSNGEVFLQRDMTAYLQAKVFKASEVLPSENDHGHDHKDAMLRTFLNRPQPSVSTLNKYFNDAAAEFNVPVSILKASAQVQSNWAQVSESMYGSWGVMGIIENHFVQQISRAASLLSIDPLSIKNEAQTNIRAAAALLASYQKNKPASVKVEDWFESVKELTGLRDEEMKNELAVRIFDVMKSGSKTVTLWNEIILIEPINVDLPLSVNKSDVKIMPTALGVAATVDYTNAVPNFTPVNFGSRPAGSGMNFYFVHYVATGTYQGAISWFKDPASQVSAHYVVRNSDGQVSQVVAEADRAWSQGVNLYNDQGIGVEHEVLTTNLSMWDSEPMLVSAAKLCADVCNRRGIPKIRRGVNGDRGIYGHNDVKTTDCPNLTQARWDNLLSRIANASASVAMPTLYSISNPGTGSAVTATWKANIESNLAGYRLYYANNDALTSWSLAADEITLMPTTTSITLNTSQFAVPPSGDVYHFKLTAVVTDGANPPVESAASDVYSRSSNVSGPKVLIVDGFDRFSGSASYSAPSHPFATSYFKGLRDRGVVQVSSVWHGTIKNGTVALGDYDLVVWFTGDQSSVDSVFAPREKTAVINYLKNGGKMLVSGSEIAYNIGRAASAVYDISFMNNYLKSTYVNDGAITYTPVSGIAGTPFAGLVIPFGIVYVEDFPDAISAFGGAIDIFNYSVSPNKGGVAYKGTFGGGTNPGGMIFLGFTLETALDADIAAFMRKALVYFDIPVILIPPTANADAITAQSGAVKLINVLANDVDNGTPINPASVTIVSNPANGTASIDANGNVIYLSNTGFTGADNFQYQVQNTAGQPSNTATVSITVVAAASNCDPASIEVDDANPKRDLRGAWIASVSNIDWPSSRSLSSSQQQAELLKILDTLSSTGINSVFLQIRPECDALYASAIEPWSYWLTGTQGKAPSPFWDPLEFAVTAAHERGMELHAWINPFRAKQSTPALAANHVVTLHPEWTFVAGTSTILNPGLPDVRTYITNVVADIATRYDLDGIHFDDYFYPDGAVTTQDNTTYADNNPTGIATIADWRRNNVNMLIAKVYDTLQLINAANNRNIRFGVSPFGIWKSGVPAGITGNSSFSAMYCDPIAWLAAGKVDYIAPQLYWKVTGAQDYDALSKWWNDQAALYNRHIYPGLALYRLVDASDWSATEIQNQMNLNRSTTRNQVKGQILYSTKHIMTNAKGIKTALQANQHRYKSYTPPLSWKDVVCPNAPINMRRDVDTLRWDTPPAASDGDLPKKYVVYRFDNPAEASTHKNDGKKVFAIVSGTKVGIPTGALSYFVVTSLDKNNNESIGSAVSVLPITGLELQVQLSGNTSIVNWKTLSEINTKIFEIERSTDGRNFNYVATVAAAGNSHTARNYSLQDLLPAAGTYYYRIKAIDQDGKNSYSEIKSVVYQNTEDHIVVGPNPFESGINISNLSKVIRLDLIDVTGRILLSKKLKNESFTRLEVPKLPAGLYHLKVTKTNGSFSIIKLVKL